MTVEELLNHFSHYFDRIRYSINSYKYKTFKFDDFEDFSYSNEIELQYENFIDEYGSLTVDDWEFDNEKNHIWIRISEERE